MRAPEPSDPTAAFGDTTQARLLAVRLEAIDGAGWDALLPVLRGVARQVAPRFADVMPAEDVLGELALHAWDGWLVDWAGRVRRGRVPGWALVRAERIPEADSLPRLFPGPRSRYVLIQRAPNAQGPFRSSETAIPIARA